MAVHLRSVNQNGAVVVYAAVKVSKSFVILVPPRTPHIFENLIGSNVQPTDFYNVRQILIFLQVVYDKYPGRFTLDRYELCFNLRQNCWSSLTLIKCVVAFSSLKSDCRSGMLARLPLDHHTAQFS